jgi:hypothetical protein
MFRSRIGEEVALIVEDQMGEDPNSYPICSRYWTVGSRELDD